MENEQKKTFCTGNCLNCNFQQQVYCAAQHGHAIMANIPVMFQHLELLEDKINKLSENMCLLEQNKDMINPLENNDETTAEVVSDNNITE